MDADQRRRYIPQPDRPVIAVRLAFDAEGFEFAYRKWGGSQRADAGDWLVKNDDETYTVKADAFARTCRAAPTSGPGAFVKTTPVWATRAESAGVVRTKEGSTEYQAGDYLVSNSEGDSDQYAMTAAKFEATCKAARDA